VTGCRWAVGPRVSAVQVSSRLFVFPLADLQRAGLLIAARLHGFKRTHKEIIEVVRVCELTLRNRLSEFEQTPAGQLTPQEFETIDLEEEADPPSFSQARKRQKLSLVDKPRQEKEAASSSSSSSSAAAGAAVSVTTGDVGVIIFFFFTFFSFVFERTNK